MKTEKLELEVDFIGGQGPLTLKEEKELSEFFKQRKLLSKNAKKTKKNRTIKLPKTTA